jgi:dihydroxyacetone kinase-like predicted kinase
VSESVVVLHAKKCQASPHTHTHIHTYTHTHIRHSGQNFGDLEKKKKETTKKTQQPQRGYIYINLSKSNALSLGESNPGLPRLVVDVTSIFDKRKS